MQSENNPDYLRKNPKIFSNAGMKTRVQVQSSMCLPMAREKRIYRE